MRLENMIIAIEVKNTSIQGLTLVHVRAQHEHLQDTFMSEVGLYGRQ
jgi:hypothetical protein